MTNHIEIKDKKECMGCTACFNICPKNCIAMKEDAEGFVYPEVDLNLCIQCGACKKVCPLINKVEGTDLDKVEVFASVSKEEEIKKESSSGGVFTHLATKVIKDGGVVFGAVYDEDFNVVHEGADTLEGIEKFKGSKYVQSNLGDSYSKIKKLLTEGKKVLFSGAPCQVAGLKNYLRKDYENLITCDFICTGVPSPKLYRAYKEYHKDKLSGNKITNVEFRNKDKGWDNFSMVIETESDKYIKSRYFDPYIQGQYTHITLRPACYDCGFKKCDSGSDIKLADYWYVNNLHPEIYDYDGVSLVIAQSSKGKALLDEVSKDLKTVSSNIDYVLKNNASFSVSPKVPVKRAEYLNIIEKTKDPKVIVEGITKLTKKPLKERLIIGLRLKKMEMQSKKGKKH